MRFLNLAQRVKIHLFTMMALSVANVSVAQTYSETELSLDSYDRLEIEDWETGKRGVCERTNRNYFFEDSVTSITDYSFQNCLDIEYLLEDSLPILRTGRDDLEGLIAPSAATDFSALAYYPNLKYLQIYSVSQTYQRPGYHPLNLTPLRDLSKLEHLNINVREPLARGTLAPISGSLSLKHLSVISWNRADLSEISSLINLQSLRLQNAISAEEKLMDIEQLSGLTNLRGIDLARQGALSNIDAVRNMPLLEEINFSSTSVSNISALSELKNLRFVNLESTEVSDIATLGQKPDLIWLNLWGTHVTDLSPLRGAPHLRRLDLTDVPFESLEPLSGMNDLEVLVISDYAYLENKSRVDLSPLLSLPALRIIIIDPDRVSPAQRAIFEEKGIKPWLGDIAYDDFSFTPPPPPDGPVIE